MITKKDVGKTAKFKMTLNDKFTKTIYGKVIYSRGLLLIKSNNKAYSPIGWRIIDYQLIN